MLNYKKKVKTMKSLFSSVIFMVFCLLTNPFAKEQDCDKNLKPISDPEFAYKERGKRCEGFYKSKVAFPSFEVVGLLQGKLNYDLDSNEVVEIYSPIVKDKAIFVRAQAFPVKTYYRMDASIEPLEKLKWPIKDVILPKNLSSRKISILGEYNFGEHTVFVPLRADAKINKFSNDNKIRVFFRATVDVSVYYYWYSIREKKNYDWQKIERICRSGMPIIITIPESFQELYYLTIKAKILNSKDQWLEKSILINIGKQ